MQLAESIPGPNGGYKPTTVGYNVLRLDDNLATKSVELQYNDSCEKIEVVNFNIINANNLNNCRIEIYIGNNIERFSDIDHIEVDVLTNPRLHIEGEIEMLNPVMNQLLANVDSFSTLSE
jgi:predicted transcriptional regulator